MADPSKFVSLGDEEFLREARKIVDAANAEGTALRILGSLAIYAHSLHVPEGLSFFHRVGRVREGAPLFTDLDLMGYASQARSISTVVEDLGFRPDRMINGFFGDRRLVYYEGGDRFHLDIFLDKLEFSHDILFGKKPGNGRLELDFPTISLTDLVSELQTVRRGRHWEKRAKVGTAKPWYREVAEIVR